MEGRQASLTALTLCAWSGLADSVSPTAPRRGAPAQRAGARFALRAKRDDWKSIHGKCFLDLFLLYDNCQYGGGISV